MNIPKWQLAIMVWIAVFPTATVWQTLLGGLLADVAPVLRIGIVLTLTIPIVVWVLLPLLMKVRSRLVR